MRSKINKVTKVKTYRQIREEILNAKVHRLSDKASMEIMTDLNKGMKEFVIEQRRKEKASEELLATVMLNM
jgi:hypothetical protein